MRRKEPWREIGTLVLSCTCAILGFPFWRCWEFADHVKFRWFTKTRPTIDNGPVDIDEAQALNSPKSEYLTLWEELLNMESVADHPAEVNPRERIWFFPDKFWKATKGMSSEQVASLMEEVERYAAAHDVQALSKYSFVFVGDPYKKKGARRSEPAPAA